MQEAKEAKESKEKHQLTIMSSVSGRSWHSLRQLVSRKQYESRCHADQHWNQQLYVDTNSNFPYAFLGMKQTIKRYLIFNNFLVVIFLLTLIMCLFSH